MKTVLELRYTSERLKIICDVLDQYDVRRL